MSIATVTGMLLYRLFLSKRESQLDKHRAALPRGAINSESAVTLLLP